MSFTHLLPKMTYLIAKLSPLMNELPQPLPVLLDCVEGTRIPHSRRRNRPNRTEARNVCRRWWSVR
jgi:hypothetical protein